MYIYNIELKVLLISATRKLKPCYNNNRNNNIHHLLSNCTISGRYWYESFVNDIDWNTLNIN